MNQNEGMLTAEPPAGMELDSALGKQERGLLRGMLVLDALFLAMCVMFILLAPAGRGGIRSWGCSFGATCRGGRV